VLQATSNIRYEGVDMANLIGFSVTTSQTWSGRLQNWLDADGSTTLRGVPTRMGSLYANDWWRLDDACTRKPEWNMWLCDDAPSRNIASMYWTFDAGLQANVGGSICGNGNCAPCASVGKALHLGRTDMTGAMDIAPNPKITGPVGGFGWLLTLTAGAPKSITFSQVQVEDSDGLIVVLPYPAGTRFSIAYQTVGCSSWCQPGWGCLCTWAYRQVSTVAEVRTGRGDEYYFDGAFLYFRLTAQLNWNIGINGAYAVQPIEPSMSWKGVNITGKPWSGTITLTADCAPTAVGGQYCYVNPAVFPPSPCPAGTVQQGFDRCAVPGATPTPTATRTAAPTPTATASASGTRVPAPSASASGTGAASSSAAASPTGTASKSLPASASPSQTTSAASSKSGGASSSASGTASKPAIAVSTSASATKAGAVASLSASASKPSAVLSPSASMTKAPAAASPSGTPTRTRVAASSSASATPSGSGSASASRSRSPAASRSQTASPSTSTSPRSGTTTIVTVSADTRLAVDVAATPIEVQATLATSPADAITAAGLSLCASLASALRRTAKFPLSQVTLDTVTAQVHCGGAVPYGSAISAPSAARRRSLQDAAACDPTDATELPSGDTCQLDGFDLSITVEDVVLASTASADEYAAAVSAAMLDVQVLHSETLAELATISSIDGADATVATGLLTAGSLTTASEPTATVLTNGPVDSSAAGAPSEPPSDDLPQMAIVGMAAGAAALVVAAVVVGVVLTARRRRPAAVTKSVAPRIVVVNPIQGPASPAAEFVHRSGVGGASDRTSFVPTSPASHHSSSKGRIRGDSSIGTLRVNPLADNRRGARKTGEWT